METMTTSSPLPLHQDPGTYDEVSMENNMFLSDNLKDLKNLRKQLYSAAEYFQLSYTHTDQRQIVTDTLKDYVIKAFVSTVDHLGSVTYKVNDLLEETVDEVSRAELQASCIEQRLQTCQIYIDHESLSQQSLLINTPKYHKKYILQVGETKPCANDTKSMYKECNLGDEHDQPPCRNDETKETPLPTDGNGHRRSSSPSPRPSLHTRNYLFTSSIQKKETEKEKRKASPHLFPLVRSGSLSNRPTTPKKSRPPTPTPSRPPTPTPSRPTSPTPSRPTTPNASNGKYPSELQRSVSGQLHAQRQNPKETEHNPSKGKRLLEALFRRRKSKNDDMLYTYLDEY